MSAISTKKYAVQISDTGVVETVTIKGKNGKKVVSSNGSLSIRFAKTILNTFPEFERFGRYTHPATAVGVHLYADVNEEEAIPQVGYISTAYAGVDFPIPSPEQYPLGWAPMVSMNGRYMLGQFNLNQKERETNRLVAAGQLPADQAVPANRSQHAWNAALKHDAVDMFLKGVEIEVRTVPIQEVTRAALERWAIEDDTEARSESAQSYFSAITNKRQWQTGQVHTQRVARGEADPIVNGDGLHVVVFGTNGTKVNMMTQPKGVYQYRNARGDMASRRSIVWDPEKPHIVEHFAAFSQDVQVEIPELVA